MSIVSVRRIGFPRFLVASVVVATAYAGLMSSAAASVLVTVDRGTQQMTVNVDGKTRWVWPVSTGRRGYVTPSGNYTAFRMEAEHYSKEWDDAPMPHSIFFSKQGHAIHGTFEGKRLGSPASHGCVRLSTKNAAQLFALVKEEGLGNTKVVVTGEQPAGAPVVAERKQAPQRQEVAAEQLPPPRSLQPQSYTYQQQPAYGYQPNYGYQPSYPQPARASSSYYPPVTTGEYPSYPRPFYRY
jgi:hypothetical protein